MKPMLLAAAVLLLAACAPPPNQATLTPQEGKGQLVIYRMTATAGRAAGAGTALNPVALVKAPRMTLNGAPLAKGSGKRGVRCKKNLVHVVNLPAGEHTLALGEAADAPTTRFTITAGKTVYVKCLDRPGAAVMPERVFSPYTVKREIPKMSLGGVYEVE